tara:strand:+ start:314 stop:430 length:117 start_codon:yes stop_codon:yes gene_type:complete
MFLALLSCTIAGAIQHIIEDNKNHIYDKNLPWSIIIIM